MEVGGADHGIDFAGHLDEQASDRLRMFAEVQPHSIFGLVGQHFLRTVADGPGRGHDGPESLDEQFLDVGPPRVHRRFADAGGLGHLRHVEAVPSGVAIQIQGGFEYLAVGFDVARPPYGAALDCMNIDHEISSSFVRAKTRGCVDNADYTQWA